MNNQFILLPIEIKVREFHAKLLLSCFAAEAGFNVILGDQVEMQRHLKSLPRGIYIDKSVAKTKINNFKIKIKLGNRVVAWCEEGLIFLDPESYLKERISISSYNLVDIFFAWGKVQAETIKDKIGENEHKIIITGNPRFDLLRYPYRGVFSPEANRIRETHGPFILINTNFSLYNHYYGRDFVTNTMKEQGRLKNKKDEEFYVKWSDYLGEMYHHFLSMIRHLSMAFPHYTIIIRPHPAENLGAWKEVSSDFPNVRVIHEGNAIAWIMASDVMIHNGCTTGVEAYVLGRPAICYCPITSETYDSILPNALSRSSSSLDELTSLLKDTLNNGKDSSSSQCDNTNTVALFEQYVQGASGPTACENIISALVKLASEKHCSQSQEVSTLESSIRIRFEKSAIWARQMVYKYFKGGEGLHDYVKQKFPGLKLEEVVETIETFQGLTNRFSSVKAKQVNGTKSCFSIYKNEE